MKQLVQKSNFLHVTFYKAQFGDIVLPIPVLFILLLPESTYCIYLYIAFTVSQLKIVYAVIAHFIFHSVNSAF